LSEVRSVEVRAGAYYDSVTLMRASSAVTAVEGVMSALVAMATPLNLELFAGMGFAVPELEPSDMVVAVRARDEAAVAAAHLGLDASLAELSGRRQADLGQAAPRSITSAARLVPEANLALISVPGPNAFPEAMDALAAGLHVMVFSDNVTLAEEVVLKDTGAERGLLVMGPDCGTASIAGVGLGFANAVRPGPVGVVAASGTGSQQVMCLLDAAGVGVSHVLGVGGRDLSREVAGRSALRALQAMGDDPATEIVMVVSKPPAPEVAEQVRAAAAGLGKPVVLALLGRGHDDLTSATGRALAMAGAEPPQWPVLAPERLPPARRGALRGLFSGGTLCDEAMLIAAERLGPVRSNIPLQPDWALPHDLRGPGHLMIDFGDDQLTMGRPHPMVDSTMRLERLAAEAADPDVAVILLDVVLGHGSHPDPAQELSGVIRQGLREELAVVVSLCGTEADPQGWHRQAERLRAAGAWVHLSNADAARHAVALAEGAGGAEGAAW
jgi:FdrA protein